MAMPLAAIRPYINPARILLKQLLKAWLAYRIFRVWFPRKVKSFQGVTALVTGAGGGLGACICKEFAKRGAKHLMLWDLDEPAIKKIAEDIRSTYPSVKTVQIMKVNLAEREEIYTAAKSTLDTIGGGRVDVLVNNAGIVSGQNFMDTPDRRNELTMSVNVMAHMWTTKAFLPRMLERDGPDAAILNVASLVSFMGLAQMVDYATSKFAARGFSEAFSMELKQLGLWSKCKVSCICPAAIATNLFKGFHTLGSIAVSPEYVARRVADAYECEQELVCLPRHLRPALLLVGFFQSLGFFNLPNPRPRESPLKKFDRSRADSVLFKMGA